MRAAVALCFAVIVIDFLRRKYYRGSSRVSMFECV